MNLPDFKTWDDFEKWAVENLPKTENPAQFSEEDRQKWIKSKSPEDMAVIRSIWAKWDADAGISPK